MSFNAIRETKILAKISGLTVLNNVEVLCLSLFWYALLRVHSSFAIILKRKRTLVALLLLSYRCIVTINVPGSSSSWCRGLVCSM